MLNDIDPMTITLVVVALAVVGSIVGVARRGRTVVEPDRTTLPHGADAALWSITEVLPDPRNHLAIKDPTSQMRLTEEERVAAVALAVPPVRPAEAARSAQSLAARRAALAKRTPHDEPAPAALPVAEAMPIAPPVDLRPLDLRAPDAERPTRWGEAPAVAS